MVTHDDVSPRGPRRRWLRFGAFVLLVGFLIVWLIRAATWPCGPLDQNSGCVSSVKLDIAAVGLDPATAAVGWLSFDLSPGGRLALVGMSGPVETGWRSVLALFDAKTGGLVRVLDEEDRPGGAEDDLIISGAALSPDGSLAAGLLYERRDGARLSKLVVYTVSDGRILRTLREGDWTFDCTSMLDFTNDNKQLQCGFELFDLANGTTTSVLKDQDVVYPVPADFPGDFARAPDGTRVDAFTFNPRLQLFDATDTFSFAPDSVGLLQTRRAHRPVRGLRQFTPPVLRAMSAVALWDGKAAALDRSFQTNRWYVRSAWSRDSAFFGFVTGDLRLEVFAR
jgi:hypothetical protein